MFQGSLLFLDGPNIDNLDTNTWLFYTCSLEVLYEHRRADSKNSTTRQLWVRMQPGHMLQEVTKFPCLPLMCNYGDILYSRHTKELRNEREWYIENASSSA